MFRFFRKLIAIFIAMIFVPCALADTAFVQDGDDVVYRASKNSLKEARAAALAYCKKESKAGKCKLAGQSKPKSSGYGAVAQSKTRMQMTSGYDTDTGANDAALQGCAKETATDDVCKIVLTFRDSTHAAASADGAWHPKGPVGKMLRYDDNCYNGDCVRTFADGKKVRFQAPYCYDPFNGKWEWKPDGC